MNIEYEVRVLEINRETIVKKIESLNGKLIGSFDQKRYVYDFNPILPNKWIRLRTNGKKTTLAIKEVVESKIDGTKELEIEVSSFKETHKILNELGYHSKAYQENKRTTYELNGVELDIDDWPMIPTYLEIEGKDEKEVKAIIELLELDSYTISAKGVQDIYKDFYNIDIKIINELKF